MKLFIAFTLLIAGVFSAEEQAVVKIQGEKVEGLVKFTKTAKGVEIEGEIKGLSPGNHGFHIHQLGDLSDGCASTKGHFNPHNKQHGAPNATIRHVGDLGNIVADESGVAKISMVDDHLDFDGVNNIIGRAVVVHSGEDDLGHGGEEDSLTTGHAGGRVGCGVIGRATDGDSARISPLFVPTFVCLLSSMAASQFAL